MEHKLKFYPVGNGDCSLLTLGSGKTMIFDYYHTSDGEKEDSSKIDLKEEIKKDLNGEKEVDVLAITHLDMDHVKGVDDLFELLHASSYQGEDRIKIKELWVPAFAVTETSLTGVQAIIRQEARFRLKSKKGIRIFSVTEELKSWLDENGISKSEIEHLLVYPGKVVDSSISENEDGVKIFCHTPFKEDGDDEVRNKASIVLHLTFDNGIKYLAMGDTDCDVISRLVKRTRMNGNHQYLEWDIFNIPHHCSYCAINDEEKGDKCTTPKDNHIDDLFKGGNNGAFMIASCNPIKDEKNDQPPHYEAKRYYEKCLSDCNGSLLVTMEHGGVHTPTPISFIINDKGLFHDKAKSEQFDDLIKDVIPRTELDGNNRFA